MIYNIEKGIFLNLIYFSVPSFDELLKNMNGNIV